jgi:outer membrane protein
MKILFRNLIAAALLLAFSDVSAFAEGRIATIDLNKAFSNYWKKKEAEANLKEQQADMEKEFKTLQDEAKKAKESYQRLLNDAADQAVSSDERDKRKKLAEDKYKEWKDDEERVVAYNKQAMTRLDEQSRRVRESILKEITNVVAAKAKAGGYSLVYDSAAESRNLTPVILYNNNEFDITDAVLDQLNAAAPSASAAPATNKADEKKKDSKKDKSK